MKKVKTIKIIDNPKIKTSEILAQCKAKFDMYCYWNKEELDKNFPAPSKQTTRYFLNEVEPDKEFLGKSAREADPECKIGITLRERLLMELAYFTDTGTHLDIKGVTLCTGSRSSAGRVPGVEWNPGGARVGVGWYYLDDSSSDGGLRQAVTLESYPLVPSSDTETLGKFDAKKMQTDSAIIFLKSEGYKITKEF